jgi:hypothetical protein
MDTSPPAVTPPPSSDSVLSFWRDYLVQTRKEIDMEKTEGTKILHLKILLIGALFLLVKGELGLFAIALLPLAMIALDRMQLSRLQYIIHRWEYLEATAVPQLRRLLGDPSVDFFECRVMGRHRDGFYLPVEAFIRTVLFLPALAASAPAFAAAISILFGLTEGLTYLAALVWLGSLSMLSINVLEVYSRRPTLTTAVIVAIVLFGDWQLVSSLDIIQSIRETIQATLVNR